MKSSNRVIIAGDLLPWANNEDLFIKGDAESLFSNEICRMFDSACFSIVNLEGPLTDSDVGQVKIGPVLKAKKDTIHGLEALRVKAVALANNHITDYLQKGIDDTVQVLTEANIKYLGLVNKDDCSLSIDKYIGFSVGEQRVCIYNVSESFFNQSSMEMLGANLYDEWIVLNEIKELKTIYDYVIVIYHGGAEYFPYPTPQTRKRFHRMADCGADLITAQHTHCIGCEEWYNGSYLLYGQGNFLFAKQSSGKMMTEGLLLELVFNDGEVKIEKHRIVLTDNASIRLSEDQTLLDFNIRSREVDNEDLITERFKQLKPDHIIDKYLLAYKGRSFVWNRFKRILPKRLWRKFIESYSSSQIMRNMFTLQSDRANEDVSFIWRKLLDN